jgi:hypothetical protein
VKRKRFLAAITGILKQAALASIVTSVRQSQTNAERMRVAATWIATISLFGSVLSNGESADRLLTRIPVEFQGRWLTKSDQCESGYEGWLYVSDLQIQEAEGTGYVVSVRHITTLEIEIDMDWRSTPKGRDGGRKVGRFVLSQDGRRLIETRDGNAVSRIRCG